MPLNRSREPFSSPGWLCIPRKGESLRIASFVSGALLIEQASDRADQFHQMIRVLLSCGQLVELLSRFWGLSVPRVGAKLYEICDYLFGSAQSLSGLLIWHLGQSNQPIV